MHLKSLGIFCDVVRVHSFSRAAEKNGLSQSAASQAVQQLEGRLGVKLIDRSKRPWILTAEGDYFYRGCRKIVRQFNDLESDVRSFHEEVAGRVRVASIYSVGLSYMSAYLKDFERQHPQADVQIDYVPPDHVYDLIDRDAVDVGLVSYPKSSRQVAVELWRDEPIVLACAAEHRLARRKLLHLSDLQGVDFVSFRDGLKIRKELDRQLSAHGVAVNRVMEFDNIEVMKRAIETNAGVGLLPEPTVAMEIQTGSLVSVPIVDERGQPALQRPLGVIYRRGKTLSAVARRFIRELQDREPALDVQQTANAVAANRVERQRGAEEQVMDVSSMGSSTPLPGYLLERSEQE